MAKKKSTRDYALAGGAKAKRIAAPKLDYRPRDPQYTRPGIALIGCGGISETHLTAYRRAKYNVVALCSRREEAARRMAQRFFPRAKIFTDYRDVLARPDVQVVDLTPHPQDRVAMMRDAIDAGKHILSQKPFVLDLKLGHSLVKRAKRKGVKLAVNQNGRWAPHLRYMRLAVEAGLLGQVTALHASIQWDHNWTADTPFNRVRDLVLFDFGIHWFDLLYYLMPGRPQRVYASAAHSPRQRAKPPLLAQAVVEYAGAQASLHFDADTRHDPCDTTVLIGTKGTLRSTGPNLNEQQITLATAKGVAQLKPRGTWFPDGFHGTMGELLCAIEEDREPIHNARDNLNSLALCFAAIQGARTHAPVALR